MTKRIIEEVAFWVSVIVPALLVLGLMLAGLGIFDIAYQDGCSTAASFVRFVIGLF